jgi:hypothetical protein
MANPLQTRARKLRLRLLGAAGVLFILAAWAVASLAAGSFFVPTLIVTHYPEEIVPLAACRLYTLQGTPARLVLN